METESSETEPVRPEPVVKVKATAKVTDGMSLPKKKVNVTIKVKKTPTDFLLTRRVGRFLWRWSTSIREALFVIFTVGAFILVVGSTMVYPFLSRDIEGPPGGFMNIFYYACTFGLWCLILMCACWVVGGIMNICEWAWKRSGQLKDYTKKTWRESDK